MKNKLPEKTDKDGDESVSLAPLQLKEALSGLLGVKPPPEEQPGKRKKKKSLKPKRVANE